MSIYQSFDISFDHLIDLPIDQSIDLSFDRSIDLLSDQPIDLSSDKSMDQALGRCGQTMKTGGLCRRMQAESYGLALRAAEGRTQS